MRYQIQINIWILFILTVLMSGYYKIYGYDLFVILIPFVILFLKINKEVFYVSFFGVLIFFISSLLNFESWNTLSFFKISFLIWFGIILILEKRKIKALIDPAINTFIIASWFLLFFSYLTYFFELNSFYFTDNGQLFYTWGIIKTNFSSFPRFRGFLTEPSHLAFLLASIDFHFQSSENKNKLWNFTFPSLILLAGSLYGVILYLLLRLRIKKEIIIYFFVLVLILYFTDVGDRFSSIFTNVFLNRSFDVHNLGDSSLTSRLLPFLAFYNYKFDFFGFFFGFGRGYCSNLVSQQLTNLPLDFQFPVHLLPGLFIDYGALILLYLFHIVKSSTKLNLRKFFYLILISLNMNIGVPIFWVCLFFMTNKGFQTTHNI